LPACNDANGDEGVDENTDEDEDSEEDKIAVTTCAGSLVIM
jgi:hypothetical protein